ncbi:MAG: hypothetical protein ACRD0U_17525 [Acidimicrobiales bacterium]
MTSLRLVDRVERLAELVVALTGCPPEQARSAVLHAALNDLLDPGNALAVVASAMVSVRRGVDLREPADR